MHLAMMKQQTPKTTMKKPGFRGGSDARALL